MRARLHTLAALLAVMLVGCDSRALAQGNVQELLRADLAALPAQADPDTRALQALYADRSYRPLWLRNGYLTAQAAAMVGQLRTAEQYGLRSRDYVDCAGAGKALCAPTDLASAPAGADSDIVLTAAALRFFRHLHFGRVDPRQAGFDLSFQRTPLQYPDLLDRAATTADLPALIASMEPPFQHYRLLEQALARYRALASGEAAPTPAELKSGPYGKRIRQIELTLERWRWLPEFNSPPIIVNIPQFRLFAFRSTVDRKAEILQMDVIVGKTYPKLRTPVFAAELRYVIFRPYWDVPYSITRKEMLPDIASKPNFLERQHLQLVAGQGDASPVVAPSAENLRELAAGRLRLRQQPGEDNALGLIKFMLPNPYNVYLHSTPAHRLFSRAQRTFSHGCIRVSDPVALAEYVLRNAAQPWTQDSIVAAMHGADNVRVNLKTPIRVLILYGTALATEDGAVLFFQDIYGHDRKLETLLGLPPV